MGKHSGAMRFNAGTSSLLAVCMVVVAMGVTEDASVVMGLSPQGDGIALGDASMAQADPPADKGASEDEKKIASAAEAEAGAAEADEAKKAGAVKAAKDAVDKAAQSMAKEDVEAAHSATAAAAGVKLEGKNVKAAITEATKQAEKDTADAAKAKTKEKAAKSKAKETGDELAVEQALAKAKDDHAEATKAFAAAKVKAEKGAMKLKATGKAIKELKRDEQNAKIPVADDDKKKPAKLSAVEWAKKAGEEKLVAYRDHMAAAHAADAEAAASQALLDVQGKVDELHTQIETGQIKVDELKKLVTSSRFEAEQVRSKGKFTTEGEMAKLKYEEIDRGNEENVAKLEQELISESKKLMLTQNALASLRGSGIVAAAKAKERNALSDLAQADATARIATANVERIQERADKAAKLADMKAKKTEAARALAARKEAEALEALKKRKDEASSNIKHLTNKLQLVKNAAEKAEKAKVQKRLAQEKEEKNKRMMFALSADGKKEASAKKASLAMKEAGAKAAKGKGTPCDTCLSKCDTDVCRTWCNAQWCDGARGAAHKKEILNKLRAAKKQQDKASVAVAKSKADLTAQLAKKKEKEAATAPTQPAANTTSNATSTSEDDVFESNDEEDIMLSKKMLEKQESLSAAYKTMYSALKESIYYKGPK